MSAHDPVSLNDLLAHREWVRGFAAALVRDPADADDLAQDAWTSAIRTPPRSGASVRGWFATVMRNRVRDDARHAKIVADRAREAARDAQTSTSPADLAERAETERRVLALVLGLDEPFRDTVLLRFWRGMEPSEIAELRGVPAATVRTRLHRGLAEVRRRLDENDPGGRWRTVLVPAGLAGAAEPAVGGAGAGAGSSSSVAAATSSKTKGVAAAVAACVVAATIVVVMASRPGGDAPPSGPAPAGPGDVSAAPAPEREPRAPAPPRATPRAAPAGAGSAPPEPATPPNPPNPPVPPALAPAVAVRVTGPDGAPVRGASVIALNPFAGKAGILDAASGAHAVTSGVPESASTTDDTGAATVPWTFDPGPGRVLARTGDLCGVSSSVGMPSKEPVEIRLEPTFVVAGRVEDEDSRPIPRARLAMEADLGGGMEPFAVAVCGDDGTFRFAPLPQSFEQSTATVAAAATGFAPEWVMLKEEGRVADALVIVLRRAMVLTGRVVDEAGGPVSDVAVEVSTGDNVFTGADGRFRTGPLRPQEVRLGVIPEDRAPVAVRVKDAAPGERDLGDFVVRAGKTLRGRVVRPDGSAAKGAWVGAEDKAVGQFVRQGMADAEGRFEFVHLGDGPHEITAQDADDGPFAGARAVLTDVRAGGDDVLLTLSAGRSVLVQIVDSATGEAVKADFIVVNVRPAGAAPGEDGATTLFDTRDGRTAVRVTTESSGPHVVTVRVRGYAEYGPERVEVDDDGRAAVTAKLVREKP